MTAANRHRALEGCEATLRHCAEAFCRGLHQGEAANVATLLASLRDAHAGWKRLQPPARPRPKPEPLAHRARPAVPQIGLESARRPEKLFHSPLMQHILALLPLLEMELIGQGDDALVFGQAQDGWVLRLAQNPEPFRRYAALAATLGSPHLPAIWSNLIVDDMSIACVERLAHLDASAPWDGINSAANLAHAIADGRPWRSEDHADLEDSLRTAAAAIAEAAREHYYALDLSVENIMVRPSSGCIVFNDPWVPWGE